jgi:hypothetical protein
MILVSVYPEKAISPDIFVMLKINLRNINYMPVFNFLACLDLEQNISFLDGH